MTILKLYSSLMILAIILYSIKELATNKKIEKAYIWVIIMFLPILLYLIIK